MKLKLQLKVSSFVTLLILIQSVIIFHFINEIQLDNHLSFLVGDAELIVHMVYGEGKQTKSSYESVINVVPNVQYQLKVEVLRNDLESSSERVTSIMFDGAEIGDCNPDGDDYDCTFFDCHNTIQTKTISSKNGTIPVSLAYEGHSWDCDCDKETWVCSAESTVAGRTPMTAVARFTLTPLIGNKLNKYQVN